MAFERNWFSSCIFSRAEGGNGNGGGSKSERSGIRHRGLIAGVIAGALGIGDRGGFWAVTEEFSKFSGVEVGFTEKVEVHTFYTASINIEILSETSGKTGLFIVFSDKSAVDSRI